MAKITLVSRNFPPLSGGMERLVYEMYRGLSQAHEVRLLGPHGCKQYASPGSEVGETRISPTLLFVFLTALKGVYLRVFKGASEVVIGGSGLVGPVVILLARLSGARSVVLLHGLDIIADSRAYQWFFVPLLRRADVAVCNSRNTARLAVKHGVAEERIVIINPGVTLPGETPAESVARAKLGFAGEKVLLSVGRLLPRKGITEFIDKTLSLLVKGDPDWRLLIAGSEPKNALNRPTESVLANIEMAIARHGLQDKVKLLGHADDDQLAVLYAAADAFVFPLVETPGDVEGFGMVAIEAAAFGTPTVAFDCGGVGDAVVDGINGALVDAGDYAGFADAIRKVVAADLRQSSRQFAQDFSWANYGRQIESCLDEVTR